MYAIATPTSQRFKPITFILMDGGTIASVVTLPIRPEDLTRTEPSRATVHQTPGRGVTGWLDNLGPGIPTVTLSGHTGWRYTAGAEGGVLDGFDSFDALNQLVAFDYHLAKQNAIDDGVDPAEVKLLFADTVDNFIWSVVPTQFVLRRSRSRPLLYQYNITLQAIETDIDWQAPQAPTNGNAVAGQASVAGSVDTLQSMVDGGVGGPLGSLGSLAGDLAQNAAGAEASGAAALARDIANAGINAFGSLLNIAAAGIDLQADALGKLSALLNIACVFSNSLSPAQTYENYSSLYGASNCSSTTGGSLPSPLAGQNVFALMVDDGSRPVSLTSGAVAGIQALVSSDPVLAPLSGQEAERYIDQIVSGVNL